MKNHIESMQKLINAFEFLPSVGKKTAERYAYDILNFSDEQVKLFVDSLKEVKEKVHFCKVCGTFTDREVCDICENRKSDTICVVKSPKDVIALEKAKDFNCLYHVLHGTISPLENKGPNDIRIKELVERISEGGVKEVVIATNPDVEGEVTATYISRLIKPLGVKVTRLAQGISIGSDLQYADEVTLTKAMQDRKEI